MDIVFWEGEECCMRKKRVVRGTLNGTIEMGDTHGRKRFFEEDSDPGRHHVFLLNVIPQYKVMLKDH